MSDVSKKPPTQGIGVQGFSADLYASDEVKPDWARLIHLPTFQGFVIEKSKLPYDNVMEWITGFVQDQIRAHGELGFFEQYSAWHSTKGCWPNENVYGELIDA